MRSGGSPAILGDMVPVVIAARSATVRAGLCRLVETASGVQPVAVTTTVAELLRLLSRTPTSVVVVDELLIRDTELHTLTAVAPRAAFVVVGMQDHPGYVQRSIDAGAVDYVRLDDAERLVRAVAAAGRRSRPSVAARRRAGTRAMTLVPSPGADSTATVPPSSSMRSRMPSSP